MNRHWPNQPYYPPGVPYPAAGYWAHPAPAMLHPSWRQPKHEAFFNVDRYKSHKSSSIHPVLAADTTLVRVDLRKQPSKEGVPIAAYYESNRSCATATFAIHMRLISKDFPWVVEIKTKHNIPVTCDDVWSALHSVMQQPLVDSEWAMLVIMDKERAKKIEKSVKKRQETDKDAKATRLDFIGDLCIFRGLEKDDEFAKRRLTFFEDECPETWVVKLAAS